MTILRMHCRHFICSFIMLMMCMGNMYSQVNSKVVVVSEPGTLVFLLTDDEKNNIESLTVVGKLNGEDIHVLRYMTGRNDQDGKQTTSKLADLDLSKVEFVYDNINVKSDNLSENVYIYKGGLPERMFMGCNVLKTIVLPETVTSIGKFAFYDCYSLTSIVISDDVTSIWEYAFKDCSSLASIVIPDGVARIWDGTFDGCSSLTSIVIPEGVTSIEQFAFYNCCSLTSIVIPKSVINIGDNAFSNCSFLTSIVIPDGVPSIGGNTFSGCTSLASIVIPQSVTSIGFNAFNDCSSLTSIVIPDGVARIWDGTFFGCSSLTSIVVPEGVSNIGERAFADCFSLTSVVIPKSVTSIGSHAFTNCSSLTSIVIPDRITNISEYTFGGCTSLTSIVIPKSVTSIGPYAFGSCNSLTSIDIPDRITNIEQYAFSDCSSLTSIVIPKSVTSIGDGAFYYCRSLTSIVIPAGIKNIKWSFDGCPLLHVTITGNAMADYNTFTNNTHLLDNHPLIFVDEGLYDQYASTMGWCDYNRSIISADMLKPVSVEITSTEDESALFTELGNNSKYVTNLKIKGSINGYDIMTLRNKTIHLLYLDLSEANIVANDGGYEYYSGCSLKDDNVLGNNSFADLSLREVILPKSLRSIGDNAFSGCRFLEKVVLQDGLLNIGNEAFSGCFLKDIELPGSLLEIGDRAFNGCTYLRGLLTIPDKVTIIKTGTFAITGIDSLIVGRNVHTIGSIAFENCSNLQNIRFNRKLTKIDKEAFAFCRNLLAAELPYSVEEIESKAFYNCTSLESMKIPSMTKKIGGNAFNGCNNIKNVYTYTVEPTAINQNTFSSICYSNAMLNVPKTSANLYVYNTQWSQFLDVQEFEEPYDAFYLYGDVELDDRTGRMSGEPDADMYETSGFIVEGDETQELSSIELQHNGTNGASIIGSLGSTSSSTSNLTAKSMKVNISVDGNRWYFFCFPFDVDRDSIQCSTDYVFYSYDGGKRANAGSGWTKLDPDFTSLQKGLGYIFQASRTGILTIHVSTDYLTFNATDEKDPLTSYTSSDAANAHWNFIGNPYISYYDVQDLAREYDAPIVVWNGRGYDVYKPGDDDYQLKPFEAFFVQKETGTSYVEFLPENRITYNQATTRASLRAAKRASLGTPISLDRQLVNITIMDKDSVSDRTRVVYSTKAAMDYEIGVDAAKFQADGVPQIYTLNGTTKYAINERPMGTDDIKLGYTAPKSGTYTLSIPRKDAEVEIYDNVTKSKVDFTFGDYTFETKAGTFNDRFVIHKTSGGVTAVENGFRLDGLTVTATNGGLDIEGSMAGKVKVYSESGILLAEPSRAGRIELGDGVYIIKVGDISIKLDVL